MLSYSFTIHIHIHILARKMNILTKFIQTIVTMNEERKKQNKERRQIIKNIKLSYLTRQSLLSPNRSKPTENFNNYYYKL